MIALLVLLFGRAIRVVDQPEVQIAGYFAHDRRGALTQFGSAGAAGQVTGVCYLPQSRGGTPTDLGYHKFRSSSSATVCKTAEQSKDGEAAPSPPLRGVVIARVARVSRSRVPRRNWE